LPGLAADTAEPRDVSLRLTDGSVLIGKVVSQDERQIRFVTRSGVEVVVPRAAVASMDGAPRAAGDEHVVDDTRLFLAPTGRPLRKGAGYFSDHYILFPGVAYGLTDNITLAGGVSLIPTVPVDEQAFFFTPKVGARLGRHVALSAGGLFLTAGGSEGESLKVGYVVGTWGTPERSLTAGVGLGGIGDDDFGDRRDPAQPMLMLGGAWRLSNRLSLLTENWLLPDEEFEMLSAGLRFRGDRLTVDFAFFTNHDLVDAGGLVVIPWVSFSYHFSPPRARK
jgi:hypothetical protein